MKATNLRRTNTRFFCLLKALYLWGNFAACSTIFVCFLLAHLVLLDPPFLRACKSQWMKEFWGSQTTLSFFPFDKHLWVPFWSRSLLLLKKKVSFFLLPRTWHGRTIFQTIIVWLRRLIKQSNVSNLKGGVNYPCPPSASCFPLFYEWLDRYLDGTWSGIADFLWLLSFWMEPFRVLSNAHICVPRHMWDGSLFPIFMVHLAPSLSVSDE